MKFKQPLKKLENTANWRKRRGLSLYGRAQIINSLLLPKLIYMATMFAVPKEVIKDINCGYTHLGFGVFWTWVKKSSKKDAKIHSTNLLEFFCTTNRSKKHQIFEK